MMRGREGRKGGRGEGGKEGRGEGRKGGREEGRKGRRGKMPGRWSWSHSLPHHEV